MRVVERPLMNDIPEAALRTIEETFGTRFVPHAADEAGPHAEQPFASVFPESAKEVESLMKLAEHHSIPLVARGAAPLPIRARCRGSLWCVSMGCATHGSRRNRERIGSMSSRGSLGWFSETVCARRVWDLRSTLRAHRGPPSAAGWLRTGWG